MCRGLPAASVSAPLCGAAAHGSDRSLSRSEALEIVKGLHERAVRGHRDLPATLTEGVICRHTVGAVNDQTSGPARSCRPSDQREDAVFVLVKRRHAGIRTAIV